MKASLLACCFALLVVATGCGGKGRLVVRAEAAVPIVDSTAAATPQARVLPWADTTLRAAVAYPIVPKPPDEAVPAPLYAGESRLLARQQAERQLAEQLAKLPASDPAPGDAAASNLKDFAARHEGMNALIADELRKATESVRELPGRSDTQALELELPMATVGREVLSRGGGFLPDGAIASAIGGKAAATRAATTKAEEALTRTILETRIPGDGKRTWAEWVRMNPGNRAYLVEAVRQKKTVRSEVTVDPKTGDESFVVEYETDVSLMHRAVKAQKKRFEEDQKKQ